MEFDGILKTLESVDASALADTVLAQPASAWAENRLRQQTFDVHYQTESLVMLFIECDQWPLARVSRQAGWNSLAPLALPLMKGIIHRHYPPGGVVLRAMAAKLLPGAVIKPHVDAHPSFRLAHRIHIPLSTNDRVRFMIGGRPHQLQLGTAYELNNQCQHSVMNKGDQDRITFIFDYLPPDRLAEVTLTGDTLLPETP